MITVAECSFLLFVYPFVFDAGEFDLRAKAFGDAQSPLNNEGTDKAQRQVNVWEPARFPGADMLAYVAKYLNPSEGAHATARLWQLNDELQNVYGLAGRADWRLIVPKKDAPEIPYRFGEVGKTKNDFAVQLALFRVGVGFITVRVQPQSNNLDRWLDFIHFFRFVKGQRDVAIRAEKRTGFDRETKQATTRSFFPELAGMTGARTNGQHVFDDLLDSFLKTGSMTVDTRSWWREVLVPEQMIPFAVIFADGVPEGQELKIGFKLRSFFHSRQGENPSSNDLAADHPNLLPYAERQWFTFSLDGGAFLACDAPNTQFFRSELPVHLRDQYFILFLLSLHQRFVLMSVSQQVSDNWLHADDTTRVAAFSRIRDTLLEFMARGLFTQVMQREHHHLSYMKWQQKFQIAELHQEALEEVREMHNYLQMKRAEQIRQLAEARQQQAEKQAQIEKERERAAQDRSQRLEQLISTLTICIGVPAIILGFLSVNLYGITAKEEGLRIWIALLVVIGTSALLVTPILTLLRQERSKSEPDAQSK